MILLNGMLLILGSLAMAIFTLLVVVRIGFGRLESRVGIEGDGPARNRPAPPLGFNRPTTVSAQHGTRPLWCLLVFADHSLASFPMLVSGLNNIALGNLPIDVVVLTRSSIPGLPWVETVGLQVPVVKCDEGLYERYRVRVIPYGVLVDPYGIVRWASVVNYEEQILHNFEIARAGLKLRKNEAAR